jgi:hypothetical protein
MRDDDIALIMKMWVTRTGAFRWTRMGGVLISVFVLFIVVNAEADVSSDMPRRIAMPLVGLFFLYLIFRAVATCERLFDPEDKSTRDS